VLTLRTDLTNFMPRFVLFSKIEFPCFIYVCVWVLLHKCQPMLVFGLDSVSINCKVLQAVTIAWNMVFR
jgi:hypothetical protein